MAVKDWVERLRIALGDRQIVYRRTFTGVPGSPVHLVLKDLARFCRAHESTFHPTNEKVADNLAGRREVWLRIQEHLNLTPDQLWELYAGRTPTQSE